MKIFAIELRRIALPLVVPFTTAHGTTAVRASVLVRLATDVGDGWGECSALPTLGYAAESTDTAWSALHDDLSPLVVGRDVPDADALLARVAAIPGHAMAKTALELAALDVELTARGVSLAQSFGVTRWRVPAGVAIGITETVDELVALVADYVAQSYEHVKVKIQPGWDLEPVRAVRAAFPALGLQVDANGSYSAQDTASLAGLDAYSLSCIEQPLAADDLAGHAALRTRLASPICLDESVTSIDAARTIIAMGAADALCVKAPRLGGYAAARALHDLAVDAGLPLRCGGMLDTGIARAANLALAALPGFTITGDLSASARYFTRDITTPTLVDAGTIAVPERPGVGFELDHDALDAATVASETFTT
jgi:O-succinylbenzoate synthase